MIKAQIVLRARSQLYRYVRDVTTDTYGVSEQYYGYRGNARRKLNLTRNNISSSMDTGLERNKVYSFRVGVNGGDVQEYTFSFQEREGVNRFGVNKFISYFDLLAAINGKANSAFSLKYDDYDRNQEGLYFIAGGRQAGTTIVVEDGTGENPLFASLEHFDSVGDLIESDNFFDQTDAGQIKADFDALSASVLEDDYVMFPESGGSTDELVRINHDNPEGLVINKVKCLVVENLNVVENVVNVRENHFG